MKRMIESKITAWFESNSRKPLVIHGARQVGKTFSIRSFAKSRQLRLVEINFEKDLQYIELFNKTRNPNEILEYLKLSFLDVSFNEETLLFFDEIQASPSALTALKFLGESFPSKIIASGSALGVAIGSTSFPVGYVEMINMTPMTFIEFLWAIQLPEETMQSLQEVMKSLTPLPAVIHDKMNNLFKSYMIVGGMPEVVNSYVAHKSYKDTFIIQQRLINDYYNDMAKYAQGSERIKVRECYQSIPLQLAKDNKKFQYKIVKSGAGSRHYESSLKWLEESHMIIKSYRLNSINPLFESEYDLSTFKVFHSDTGLLISMYGEELIQLMISSQPGTVKGGLYENVIAQLLKTYHKKIFYFEPNQHSEIDFIVRYEGKLCPIEVKSSNHTSSRSFANFIQQHKPKLSVRVSSKNLGNDVENNTYFLPHYLFEFFLGQEESIL